MHKGEIHLFSFFILYQEQTGTDGQTGSDRNRQGYISDIKIVASWLSHHKEIHMSDRKFRIREQTGSDRNRQDYISDIENCCIIIIAS